MNTSRGIHFYTREEIHENRRREQKLYEAALDAQPSPVRSPAGQEEALGIVETERVDENGDTDGGVLYQWPDFPHDSLAARYAAEPTITIIIDERT